MRDSSRDLHCSFVPEGAICCCWLFVLPHEIHFRSSWHCQRGTPHLLRSGDHPDPFSLPRRPAIVPSFAKIPFWWLSKRPSCCCVIIHSRRNRVVVSALPHEDPSSLPEASSARDATFARVRCTRSGPFSLLRSPAAIPIFARIPPSRRCCCVSCIEACRRSAPFSPHTGRRRMDLPAGYVVALPCAELQRTLARISPLFLLPPSRHERGVGWGQMSTQGRVSTWGRSSTSIMGHCCRGGGIAGNILPGAIPPFLLFPLPWDEGGNLDCLPGGLDLDWLGGVDPSVIWHCCRGLARMPVRQRTGHRAGLPSADPRSWLNGDCSRRERPGGPGDGRSGWDLRVTNVVEDRPRGVDRRSRAREHRSFSFRGEQKWRGDDVGLGGDNPGRWG